MALIPLKIGIIGGSGLDDPDILENRKEIALNTPFGHPSDKIIDGDIGGVNCALLARHGRKHNINPSNVNYRANIWALRQLGCTHVLVTTACGSLKEDIRPGDLVVPNDIIDRTTKRVQTFYDGNTDCTRGVCHMPMFPPFSERTRKVLLSTALELGYERIHSEATMVTIEGPRFSTRAESNMFRQWGCHLVNMTSCPEAVLAKEAGLLYGAVAIATDYDCWRVGCESVNVQDVLKTFGENVVRVKNLLIKAVQNIAKEDWTDDIQEAKKCVTSNMMGSTL